MEREEELRNSGYRIVSITSCEWVKQPESKQWYHTEDTRKCTHKDIWDEW